MSPLGHYAGLDPWRQANIMLELTAPMVSIPKFAAAPRRVIDSGMLISSTAFLQGEVAAPVTLAMRGEVQNRRRGRDDLAVAIVLAVAEGVRTLAQRPQKTWRSAELA